METFVRWTAIVVLVLGGLGGFGVPALAESLIATELEDQLGDRFGVPVDVVVDVAAPGALLDGRIASIVVTAPSYVTDVGGTPVELRDLRADLVGIEVADIGAAFLGTLAEVTVASSDVEGSIPSATVGTLVEQALRDQGLEVTMVQPMAGGVLVRVLLPDGREAETVARPFVEEGAIRLLPTEPEDDDPPGADAIREAIAAVRLDVPTLPLGIVVDDVRSVGSDVVVVGARVPSTIDLSGDDVSS